ncbi:hypothetical protein HS088_TW09G01096 [Tripterygium wilfordii]|uniref:VWFA domain-containing protein n=1 Tax=Tripterygium wilfordii TaxID=458696 RepID=A0A7J7D9R9_TRIWF|nr:uncharacterized protein LOC120005121 [Tripterygium wilfordii]KAF5743034.1 hypothetical protein HS088_TW09G01096 [Tripterygium wilfordii]
MAEEFAKSVEDGLKLSKRIYMGKDRAVAAPRPPPSMEKSSASLLPASPMVYAVISNPVIVDNPDIPSYQPHVHGRCDPPALIPLQMNGIELEVDCYLDTAFVRVSGSWRVHCVMGSRSCPCRIAVPMGEQGSILGVEVEIPRKSYSTQLISWDDKKSMEKEARAEDGGFLKQNIFTLTIPQVDGGSNLSIRLSWSQKLSYSDGQFSLNVPFSFPEHVTPAVKKLAKREKIQLNVNSGIGTQISCKMSSHPLKEVRRHVGKFGFSYEADVLKWSNADFTFSYDVLTSHVFGGVLLQPPSVQDADQREMFCVYLFPGNQRTKKVFKKDVIYIIDISGSMKEKPLEYTKNALFGALSQMDSEDRFNIIAFNGETYLFSSSLESASDKIIEKAIQWVNMNFIAGGTTNIMIPLKQAIEMLSSGRGSVPIIFLVTDGTVEDERQICDFAKSQPSKGSIKPRIYTFGIGTYCNHYFLQMLAMISGGLHDAAYDVESVEFRMQKFFASASSAIVANIAIDLLDDLDGMEVYPPHIQDLSYQSPLILSGRYRGKFPDFIKVNGVLADLSAFALDLKTEKAKEIPLDRLLARQHIDLLTAMAWLSEDKKLEEKVANMSIQTGVTSEYTCMMLLETDGTKAMALSGVKKASHKKDSLEENKGQRAILLRSLSIGFGNLTATVENVPPGFEEPRLPEAAEIFVKAASNCCNSMCNRCCCMCCFQCCSKMNDQCAIALTQLCAALACFGCFECCSAICCCGGDGD